MPSQLSPQTLPHSHHHHHHCFTLPHRHHHHHCLYTSVVPSLQLCPCLLYHNHHHHHHVNGCSSHVHFISIASHVISSTPPNSCPVPACSSSGYPKVSTAAEASVSQSGVQPQDQNQDLILEDFGEEEELEDVFVLTDEWREFFAKSEAKRRMDKQQKKKHRKRGA